LTNKSNLNVDFAVVFNASSYDFYHLVVAYFFVHPVDACKYQARVNKYRPTVYFHLFLDN